MLQKKIENCSTYQDTFLQQYTACSRTLVHFFTSWTDYYHEVFKIKVFIFIYIFLGDDIKKPEKLCKHDLQCMQENCGRQKQSPGSSRIVNAIRMLNSQKRTRTTRP